MNEILIALIASGTISTLLNILVTWIKDVHDKKHGLKASMRILLDDRLTVLGEKYLAKGSITSEELKIFEKMHEAYRSLGGNGYHKLLMEKINKLEIRKES